MLIQILYCAAAIIALGACVPQIYQLLRRKQADSFSLSTWTVWTATQLVTLIYVSSIRNRLMIVVSIAWVAFYIVMVCLILHYRNDQFRYLRRLLRRAS